MRVLPFAGPAETGGQLTQINIIVCESGMLRSVGGNMPLHNPHASLAPAWRLPVAREPRTANA